VHGVKRKRRESLGLTTGVGSIYSVQSPTIQSRSVTSNSSGKTRTDIWSHCGKKRDVLPWEDITEERLLTISKIGRNASKEGHDDEELENNQEVERDGTQVACRPDDQKKFCSAMGS
jgi:hypothetical protein